MNNAWTFFLSNIMIIIVVGASALAITFPTAGKYLDKLSLISPLIVLVFFCQGTGVKKMKSDNFKNYSKVLILGFFISQILAPVLGWLCVKVLGWTDDSMVGFILICSMAPTLVSGTIIAEQAGGDRTASLLVTIVINIIAVFTIPLNLSWALGADVPIEVLPLLKKLLLLVLVPALIGHMVRNRHEELIVKHKNYFKYIPLACLAAIIYISMSRQAEAIRQLTAQMIFSYSLASIIVHLILLYVAYYLSIMLKTGVECARSVAICCSQKTIPITVAIWTSTFSGYALALLPAIIFHLSQIYCDGLIAKKWSRS